MQLVPYITCSYQTVPTAFLSPAKTLQGQESRGTSLPGVVSPSLVYSKRLTCNAIVKWLVFVSRTMLVFMADWMPHRHCKYPIVFLSRLRARTVVRPGRIPRDENCSAQFVVMKLGDTRKASSATKCKVASNPFLPRSLAERADTTLHRA